MIYIVVVYVLVRYLVVLASLYAI